MATQGQHPEPQGCAGSAPGAAGPRRVSTQCHRAMQDLPTTLQGRAGPAPSTSRPWRISTQCHGAMQDPQMMLRSHAGPVFATVRPRRACKQHCRARSTCTQICGAVQDPQPAPWIHAGPTAGGPEPCRTCSSAAGPCRTHSAHHAPHRTPGAMPAPQTGLWGRAGSQSSRQDLCPVQRPCAILCHPAPGAGRSPSPGPVPSRLVTFAPRQSWAPRCPHRGRPRRLSSPRPPHPEGPPKPLVAPGGRGGGGAPRPPLASPAAVGPSTSERPGRGSLPLASTPQRARRPEPAPFTVREETATGRDPPGASPCPSTSPCPTGSGHPAGTGAAPGRTPRHHSRQTSSTIHRTASTCPRSAHTAAPGACGRGCPTPTLPPPPPRCPRGHPPAPSGARGHPTRGTEGTRSLQTMHGQGSDGPAAAVTLPGSHPGSPGHHPPATSPAPRM